MCEIKMLDSGTPKNNLTVSTLFDAIDSSNMAHTLASVEGDRPLIYINQAFLDETGYSREEVLGRNCRFLQGEGTKEHSIQMIKKALNDYVPIDIEILNYRKDGTPFLNRLRISTVFDKDGRPLAYLGLQSNVNTLVENVRASQEKYRMESLGRLSANLSHEIKNTLQPIRLMLESLQDFENLSNDHIRRCIAIAIDNVAIAESIVKDTLYFSKQDTPEKARIEVVELVRIVSGLIQNFCPSTASFKVSIDNNIDSLAVVAIHQNGIYQVMTNLVNNALDATGQHGQLHFIVTTRHMTPVNDIGLKSGPYICMSLEDNGHGVDEKARANIFQPFFSTKSPSDGTGLGLAISRKIAKDHDGTLIAENVENGARFSLLLPLLKPEC